ncbi:META domain-containing protein [Desulfovibrio sp. OttesenSCG-928-C06]|nr:META domain-containing protein [Desulfovibrio sp. OttesenSCG-928-C06]
MKNRLFLLLAGLLIIGSFGFMGCAKVDTGKTVGSEQLIGKDFHLAAIDGQPFEWETPLVMHFDENMRISGNFCNRYVGQATLEDGVLTVKQMASTKMLCIKSQLNEIEQLVPGMLMNGAALSLDGGKLSIRQGEHEVVYIQAK